MTRDPDSAGAAGAAPASADSAGAAADSASPAAELPPSAAPATTVVALVVDQDEIVGTGGFLAVRRARLRNRRADGTVSRGYVCDFLHRPYGQDAVVVVLYRRVDSDSSERPGTIEVLLRDGLRPALLLGRDPGRAPLPEAAPGLFHRELVAGIIEPQDLGLEGLLRRAAAESAEEAGVVVDAAALRLLGAGTLPSPGAMVEKFYFVAGEVAPDQATAPPAGDGSPMEDDARLVWMELHAAIAASVAGELCDAKTELGLRRLRDMLSAPTAPAKERCP